MPSRIDIPQHPKGRFLMQRELGGVWWLHESNGTPCRPLNEYENMYVCAAYVPPNVLEQAKQAADKFAARLLVLAQESERKDARITELQTALMYRRTPRRTIMDLPWRVAYGIASGAIAVVCYRWMTGAI